MRPHYRWATASSSSIKRPLHLSRWPVCSAHGHSGQPKYNRTPPHLSHAAALKKVSLFYVRGLASLSSPHPIPFYRMTLHGARTTKGDLRHQRGDHGAGSSLMRQAMWTCTSLSLDSLRGRSYYWLYTSLSSDGKAKPSGCRRPPQPSVSGSQYFTVLSLLGNPNCHRYA